MNKSALPLVFLLLATVTITSACEVRKPREAALVVRAVEPNPGAPAAQLSDVAVWSGAAGSAGVLYFGAGPDGLDVNAADGSHLQRLGSTPAAQVAVFPAHGPGPAAYDFLVASDPAAVVLRWFEIHPRSGALRRIARSQGAPEAAVTGLCVDAGSERREPRLVIVTDAPSVEEWSVATLAAKIPDRANEVTVARERQVALDRPSGTCAVDPSSGDRFVISTDGGLWRLPAEEPIAGGPTQVVVQRIGGGATPPLTGIEVVGASDGGAALLATTADGRLMALAPSGEIMGELPLAPGAGSLAAGADLLAFVGADGNAAYLASLSEAVRLLELAGSPAALEHSR